MQVKTTLETNPEKDVLKLLYATMAVKFEAFIVINLERQITFLHLQSKDNTVCMCMEGKYVCMLRLVENEL